MNQSRICVPSRNFTIHHRPLLFVPRLHVQSLPTFANRYSRIPQLGSNRRPWTYRTHLNTWWILRCARTGRLPSRVLRKIEDRSFNRHPAAPIPLFLDARNSRSRRAERFDEDMQGSRRAAVSPSFYILGKIADHGNPRRIVRFVAQNRNVARWPTKSAQNSVPLATAADQRWASLVSIISLLFSN